MIYVELFRGNPYSGPGPLGFTRLHIDRSALVMLPSFSHGPVLPYWPLYHYGQREDDIPDVNNYDCEVSPTSEILFILLSALFFSIYIM